MRQRGKAERHRHFDAGGKQRNQYSHFGQHFQQRRFLEWIEMKQIEHGRPDQQPHRQIDDGGRDRQALENGRSEAHDKQQPAYEQKPECVSHGASRCIRRCPQNCYLSKRTDFATHLLLLTVRQAGTWDVHSDRKSAMIDFSPLSPMVLSQGASNQPGGIDPLLPMSWKDKLNNGTA